MNGIIQKSRFCLLKQSLYFKVLSLHFFGNLTFFIRFSCISLLFSMIVMHVPFLLFKSNYYKQNRSEYSYLLYLRKGTIFTIMILFIEYTRHES